MNCPRYIEYAVRSILDQTLRELELIVVDSSNDETRAILERLARSDARMRLVRRPPRGLSSALNVGLSLATGKYIARMDADDVSMPERLAIQVDFLERNPAIGIVGSQACTIDKEGKRIREALPLPWTHEDCLRTIIRRSPLVHPSVMVRASVMEPYAEDFRVAEDYELFSRLITKTRFANIPQALLDYRWDFDVNATFRLGKQTEWKPLVVRWRMLRNRTVPAWQAIYLIKPALSFLVPIPLKRFIIKKLYGVR
jgi:glycosyltransferase involved in cell wall biosynthesis